MKDEYQHDNTSVHLVNYHFVWAVRRRRKIIVGELEQRLKKLISEALIKIDCTVIALETDEDHVHLFVQAHPRIAPYQIIHRVKGYSSFVLRKELPELKNKLPSLWTRSYFVSTAGNVSSETIKRYVEEQQTR